MQIQVLNRLIPIVLESGLYITSLLLNVERGYISGKVTFQTTNIEDMVGITNIKIRNCLVVKRSKYGVDITRYFEKIPLKQDISILKLLTIPGDVQAKYERIVQRISFCKTLKDIFNALCLQQQYIKQEGRLRGIGVEGHTSAVYTFKSMPYIFTNNKNILFLVQLDMRKGVFEYTDILCQHKSRLMIPCVVSDCVIPVGLDDSINLSTLILVCYKEQELLKG